VSTLRDRLTRLKSSARSEPVDTGREDVSIEQASSKSGDKPPEEGQSARSAGPDWDALQVYPVETSCGSFLRRRIEYPAGHRHGHYCFADLEEAAPALAVMTGSQRAPISPDRILFIDTETTGLGVGAGNVPFMIGIGAYEQGAFWVEQLFIRHPGEEAAMLTYLSDKLQDYTAIVSYNGRTFDWPVIKNRFVMNRLPLMKEEPLHLDFLYPSRSLWKHTLESCRLSRVEEDRLGIVREHDVPGSLAPSLYFLYLAERNAEVLRGVFEHNERDIMTLATLAVHLARAASGLLETAGMEAEETYRLALWLEKLGRSSYAKRVMDQLLERSDEELHRHFNELAAFYKKNGQWEAAITLWNRCVRFSMDQRVASMEPYIELAMYYEHKLKDIPTALEYAAEAMELLVRRKSLKRGASASEKWRTEELQLRKRMERLERKLAGIVEPRAVSKHKQSSGEQRARKRPSLAEEQLLLQWATDS
jgi:uncharacterized protein